MKKMFPCVCLSVCVFAARSFGNYFYCCLKEHKKKKKKKKERREDRGRED